MKKLLLLICLLAGVVTTPVINAQQNDTYTQLLYRALTLYHPNNMAEMQNKIKDKTGAYSVHMQEIMTSYVADHPQFLVELMAPDAQRVISEKELRTLLVTLSEPRFRSIIDSVSFIGYHASEYDSVSHRIIHNIPENDPFWDRKYALSAANAKINLALSINPQKFDTTFLQMANLVDSLQWKHINNDEGWIDKYMTYAINNGTFSIAEQTLIALMRMSPAIVAYIGSLGSDDKIREFALEYGAAVAMNQLAEYDYVVTEEDLDYLLQVTGTPEYAKLRDVFVHFFSQLINVNQTFWCNCSSNIYDYAVEHFPDYQPEIQQLETEKQQFCAPKNKTTK